MWDNDIKFFEKIISYEAYEKIIQYEELRNGICNIT